MARNIVRNGVLDTMTAEEEAQFNDDLINLFEDELTRELKRFRIKRNALLSESDWTQLPDSPLSDTKKTEWATYRTNLRNLTNGLTTVAEVRAVTWPTKP